MSTVVLSSIFNAVLSAIAAYFLTGYLLRNTDGGLSFVLACVFAAGAGLAVWFVSSNRLNVKKSRKIGESAYRERMFRLYLCTDDEIQEIFRALMGKLHICARVCGRHMRVGDSFTVVCPLNLSPMTADELMNILRLCPYSGKYAVVSSSYLPETRKIADMIGVKLFSTASLYSLLEEYSLLPDIKEPLKKPRFITRFSSFLYKTNGRRFLIYGTFLFVLSSFAFYPVYYVVFGTVFVVYGLIATFFGKEALPLHEENLKEFLVDRPNN